jgi:hypothetical protein
MYYIFEFLIAHTTTGYCRSSFVPRQHYFYVAIISHPFS